MKTNSELTHAQESYRRGSTSFHAKRALTAKAILKAIRETPGITKPEILEVTGTVSGHGGFELLQKQVVETRNTLASELDSPSFGERVKHSPKK